MNGMILNMTASDNAGEGHNSEAPMKALRAELRKYGQAEALGSASRPTAAVRLVDAAFDGLIGEGDAESVYGEYQAGMVSVGKRNALTANASSEKVQVSKFRQFIKVGMLPGVDARDVMARAGKVIEDLKKAEVKMYAPFDALLNVARKQMETPEIALTDEQIQALVSKPEPKDKELLDKLIAAYKSTYKVNEEAKMPSTAAAVQALADAISEAGGDVPPMTKAEKEHAAFMAQAAKYGFTAATPTTPAE
jgi:hypothetical protein